MRTVHNYLGCGVFGVATDEDGARFEVPDLTELRDALGAEVLRAFCQCFVGTDHLRSLVHLMHLNYEHSTESQIALDRNLMTLVLLSCGVTREIAKVLQVLRGAGVRGMLPDSEPWDRLEELLKRWNNDPVFFQLRDKLAFHYDDKEMFDRGIQEICDAHERVVAFEADGRESFRMRDGIGMHVALKGLGIDDREANRVFAQASDDLETLSSAVHKVFLALIRAKRVGS